MGSPFTTTARPTTVVPATDAQIIRALLPAIADKPWRDDADAAFVSRVAVLNLVLGYATNVMDDATPPAVSRLIHNTVGRLASHGEKANVILGFLMENGQHADGFADAYAPLTKKNASDIIGRLFDMKAPRPVATAPVADGRPSADVVPAGRYAVATNEGATNTLAFYKVDRPDEGKWAGYVFVKLMVSDEERNIGRAAGDAILAKIAAVGAEAASAAYGREFEHCGVCGRGLTNDDSRARGIGPDCAAKLGW